jgi:two-component system sensor histidine kinase HydH
MNAPALPLPARGAASHDAFNLTRRFSILSFACVVAVASILGFVLARMVSDRLLHRDAVVTMEFVQSIVRTDQTAHYFATAGSGVADPLEDTFRHFAEMPDVLRTNVYSTERRAIWSTDPAVLGAQFAENDELDDALQGELKYEAGRASKAEHFAAGHKLGTGSSGFFEEIYVPVRDTAGRVVGVVELYKTPDALFEAIREAEKSIAIGAALGALLLYAALIGIVRRADAVMRDQQRRLVEGERFAILGEMASAVAHSIRNPLSTIRTSVELALDHEPGRFREPAEDIVAEVDKIDAWVRELLEFSRPGSVKREPVDLNGVVRACMESVASPCARKQLQVRTALASPPPVALGDPVLLQQVLQSLVVNAIDALDRGGRLEVQTEPTRTGATVIVRDHGPGIPAGQLEQVFKPFYSTKPNGVGLGLPLARRLVERMGGSLVLESREGEGTTVRVTLGH